MIEKRFPRKLNKSVDSRLLGPDSMSDALNINVSEDSNGNGGVIKPVKANEALLITETLFSEEQKTVVGKVACNKYNVLYFFVSDLGGGDGIYAYDPDAYLPGSQGGRRIYKVFSDDALEFDINGFVKADITYIQREYSAQGKDYVDMPYIFFTDNKSEPKKLNVLRAINQDYDSDSLNDFLFACTKAPVHPIVASNPDEAGGFDDETTFLQNEFIDIPGFQFAYQNVYKDGFESAISAYSKVFVPPGYLRYTGQSELALLNAYNAIDIVVPDDDMSSEVESVKILARRGNTGSWQVVKEVKYLGVSIPYTFLNNTVSSAVSNDVQSKQFDNLPPIAETQTIMDNRLMYGNYVDGFDNVEIEAEMTPQPSERPPDFVEYDIKVIPSTSPSPAEYEGSGGQNKNIGFTIDASTLDDIVPAGSFLSFSFNVNPKQNFHVYNAKNSYHQSPQMGDDFSNEGWVAFGKGTMTDFQVGDPGTVSGGDNPDTGHPHGFWWQNSQTSGVNFIKNQNYNFSKVPAICSDGVNSHLFRSGNLANQLINTKFRWKYFNMDSGTSGVGDDIPVDFGTSAANPFVLQGRPFTIRASFTAKQNLTRKQVAEAFAIVIDGQMTPELEELAENVTFPTQEEMSYQIDLGLNNGSSASEKSPIADLITMVGHNFSKEEVEVGEAVSVPENGFQPIQPVKGFFVVNKATVEFGVFRDEQYNEDRFLAYGQHPDIPDTAPSGLGIVREDNDEPKARFGIYVKKVTLSDDEEAVLSCMRRPLPGARWFFFAPWNKEGNDEFSAVDNVLDGEADFREYSLFPFTGPNGEEQPGLMNNPGFTGKTHHIDSNDFPQDSIHDPRPEEEGGTGQNAWGKFSSLSATQSLSSINEFHIFRKDDNNPNHVPMWATVFGGLYYAPNYAQGALNKVFFDGERGGVSQYTLMDGKAGPGGGGLDSNSSYDTYALWGLNGSNSSQYGVGLSSIGSVGLLGLRNSSEEVSGGLQGGLRGPGLNNDILINRQRLNSFGNAFQDTVVLTGIFDAFLPSVLHNGDDELTTITTSAGSEVEFNEGDPISGVTTLPFLHIKKQVSPPSGGYESFADVFVREATYFDEEGFEAQSDPNLYETGITNPDALNDVLFVIPPGTGGKQSFKAGANHGFGVVFYDERGRCSNVNPLGTVYVPWFSERQGEGMAGPVEGISINITSAEVPENATHFKFVYSGNTTMSRWIQYSSANAFVSPSNSDSDDGNIYLSLNHLQGHPISFSRAKGARSIEGAQDVYTFREGDRLRIVSYYNTSTNRVFAGPEYEFNIVDQRFLNDGPDNPLYDVDQDGDFPHPSKVGPFLVLENNINATDFTHDLIAAGGNTPDSANHGWHRRCVFEIYSPKKSAEEENLVYYEVGPVFPIEQFGGESVVIEGGDAWFKTEAINFQKLDGGNFVPLIGEQSSTSNFFPYNIESQPFSTKVANSDVWGKGKVKVLIPDASKSRKEASITYSDKNNPISKINTINSFNPVKGQYKDMPSEFGDINYMINNDDSIFVIQSNRCSSVPVNRNIITDGGGVETLVAARQVLGTERYYAGNYGCDNNPESVCDIGNTVYFASKSNRQVYKFNPASGIQVISDAGMKSYFKGLFERAEADRAAGLGEIRVVGGYDPFEDVYILSIFNQTLEETVGTTGGGFDPTIEVDDGIDPVAPDFGGDGPADPDPDQDDDSGFDPNDGVDPDADLGDEEEDSSTGSGGVGDDFPDFPEFGDDPRDPIGPEDPVDPVNPDDPRDPRDPVNPDDPRDPRDPVSPADNQDDEDFENPLDRLTGYSV